MIKVEYYEKDYRYVIFAYGHAEYAPRGMDIVCAGVSSLMQSLGNYIAENAEDFGWKVLECNIVDGDYSIDVLKKDDSNRSPEDIFHMVIDGIENLADQYPLNISLEKNKFFSIFSQNVSSEGGT